jgi:hypothetical protein
VDTHHVLEVTGIVQEDIDMDVVGFETVEECLDAVVARHIDDLTNDLGMRDLSDLFLGRLEFTRRPGG